jgi:hypothetical protein
LRSFTYNIVQAQATQYDDRCPPADDRAGMTIARGDLNAILNADLILQGIFLLRTVSGELQACFTAADAFDWLN